MPDLARRFKARRTPSTLLSLFIPSVDRRQKPIDQETWVRKAVEALARCFGKATAFPPGLGVWRDDQGGKLIVDKPVVIQCYVTAAAIAEHAAELRAFLVEMGTSTNQGAVGFVIGDDYLEIDMDEAG